MQLSVAPGKLAVKINGRNKTVTLINDGEINILKQAGLTDISFTALLPNAAYPFAAGTRAAAVLDELERLKNRVDDKGRFLPFQFKVNRRLPGGDILFDQDFTVSLEAYKINEEAGNGFDVSVDISLRQYKSYGTKFVEAKQDAAGQVTAAVEQTRAADDPPERDAYTVVKGDCLWAIAKKYLGDGSRYTEIYELNKAAIDARNSGTGNTRYTIYPGQVLQITDNR
jgi:hypothetical protein